MAVGPLQCLFNHSCAPNVEWRGSEVRSPTDGGSSVYKVVLRTTRDITVNEELCISYVDIADGTEAGRQKKLEYWLAGECLCPVCRDDTNGSGGESSCLQSEV
jgi:SET domain-containing protein